jgi:glycosyltransferase involved in cell wall biosynthesis
MSDRVYSFTKYDDKLDNIIIFHYSLGTDQDKWIESLKSRRILVYHNITPDHFFDEQDWLRKLIHSGRTQLAAWANERIFVGQIAASDYSALELWRWGYDRVATIGILVDLDRLRAHSWDREIGLDAAGTKTLLFVGRICEHKSQLELVEMMRHLVAMARMPTRLLLVGGVTSDAYEAKLIKAIDRFGMAAHVERLGKLEDDALYGLYRRADLYVSMSRHEGFGMPLAEAMALGLPVLARAGGGVAATLGEGGLVLEHGGPRAMAAAARLVLEEPALRREILEAQRRSVERYERAVVVEALERHLRRLGFEIALNKGEGETPPALWTMQGPYDSSYSLAIVNRELARGLERAGERMALESRDGPGAFAPSEAFLAANPDVAAMAARADKDGQPAVSLRNHHPPHVADMRGGFRILANYAWEESGFPPAWVDAFNTSLDLVTVTSGFVAKTLRDNGVHTPIAVVGNGVDHMAAPEQIGQPVKRGAFRFLHVSSCFPRKGVDALLAAWVRAFDIESGVELAIKTFANPHNTVAVDLEALRRAHPRHAPITLIEAEQTAAEMRALYDSADCVVCPSRGEGFGLPLAEAAALGKPLITTAYGGQSDFCTPETSWLCDFSFALSRSHLGLPGSVWVEPDVGSLAQALVACRDAAPQERARRVEAAWRLVTERYSWDRVAEATRAAIAAVRRESSGAALRLPRIGWVSTWGSRCGIATYSEALSQAIEPDRLFVFADRGSTPLGEDPAFVERCWTQGWEDPLDDCLATILARRLDAVVIQFNFGFFALNSLARLLSSLKSAGVFVCLCLHSTVDVLKPEVTIRLAEIAPTLAAVDRLLVHSVPDLNRLKAIGLVDNVTLFPHGLPRPLPTARDALRRRFFPDADPVVACFGFLLPNKGVRELIRAFARLWRDQPKAHLLLFPMAESQDEHDACKAEIAAAGLEQAVTFDVDFLNEDTILARLGAADVVVYPYQHTQESASGAIRLGLASRTPVARTPLAIFSDVETVTHALPDGSPEAIAEGLADLLADPGLLEDLERRQNDWLETHSWARLSRRLADLIRGEARKRRTRNS